MRVRKLYSMHIRWMVFVLALSFPLAEASARSLPRLSIIPREAWGADETLRFKDHAAAPAEESDADNAGESDSSNRAKWCRLRKLHYPDEFKVRDTVQSDEQGNTLEWPLQYSNKVDLIVIHQTAESLESATRRTGLERMRALFVSHTKGRGWGDIGYHFVIDDEGKIYEGRAGGPGVIGAQVYCNNTGTIGIALMGNFELQRPTLAQIRSLRLLTATLLEVYDLEPAQSVVFHGRLLPRVVGHSDLEATSDPGPYLRELLPQVRLFTITRDFRLPVYSSVLPETTRHHASSPSPPPITLQAGESRTVLYRVSNDSGKTWTSDTWLLGNGNGRITFNNLHSGGFVAGFLLNRAPVPPGKTATFITTLQAGFTPGAFEASFTPVISNKMRATADSFTQEITILPVALTYTITNSSFPNNIQEGQDLIGEVSLQNTGSVPWTSIPSQAVLFQVQAEEGGNLPLVSLLSSPERVPPGGTGVFKLNLQRIASGNRRFSILPTMSDGTPLHGPPIELQSIVVASHIPYQDEAEEQIVSRPPPKRTEPLRYGRGQLLREQQWDQYLIEGDDADLQLRTPPIYDLFRREPVHIEATIRSKGRGIANLDPLFHVQRDSNTIILLDENNRRIGSTLLAPFSMHPFDAKQTSFTLIPPGRPGDYELRIGNRAFRIHVREDLRRPRFRTSSDSSVPSASFASSRTNRLSRRRVAQSVERTVVHASPLPPTSFSSIRIRLSFEEPSAILQVSSRAKAKTADASVELPGPVRLAKDGDLCRAEVDGQKLEGEAIRIEGEPYAITAILNAPSSRNRYRGVIECRIIADTLVLINELPLEEYLWGLSEEPDTEPREKQKAFAIAARSYAFYYMTSFERKFPSMPYDGDDSAARFQLYSGVAFEEANTQWVEAVKNTEGKIISFNGEVIKSPYFSSSDGRTRSPREAGWGEWPHAPYLASKPDPWCEGMTLYGHGVGMSGCGAEGQANQGRSAEEILQYYYPGTEIRETGNF
jgi:hypothetical protein